MSPPSRKRGKPQSPVARARKKHKRLDAIFDKPLPSPPPLAPDSPSSDGDGDGDDRSNQPRRSSRARRAPEFLDSSPVPSSRRKKDNNTKPNPSVDSPTPIKQKDGDLKKKTKKKKKTKSLSRSLSFQEEEGKGIEGWKSRLRSRAKEKGKPKGKAASALAGADSGRVLKRGKMVKMNRVHQDSDLIKVDRDADVDKLSENEEEKFASDSEKEEGQEKVASEKEEEEQKEEEDNEDEEKIALEEKEEDDKVATDLNELETRDEDDEESEGEENVASDVKELDTPEQVDEVREEGCDECADAMEEVETNPDVAKIVAEKQVDADKNDENADINAVASEQNVKESDMASPMSDNKLSSSRVKEGRRCGLCGGGTDGKPPKKLVKESVDSDNEAFEGSSGSEEPNYDVWDGFGDEPGWLGRLLGPIHDRFGIARVWVHQHCAVWSPEVYFAGLGCLKNVRAALCRGRALKCSRCGRPGATIGCRVDRCPKTYHLPCSRAEGCIFDHRKFLIACNDHRRFFQPQGISYSQQIRKRKAKKLKLEIRKLSNDAWRKDLEAEEKWLEHCGEDEEFLKREGRRLHRDILRIAPTYIGGSSESNILYQGWESVAGLQGVIQCMKEVVILPLLYPDFFSNLGLTPPRGVLLHGYPGTGKTLVVRALIGACSRGDKRIAYFARKGADCLGKYVGDAERQLRLLFQAAEKCQPSIIFFDEIDGLAPVRSRHQDQTHSSVVSTLLSLMDGLKSRGSVIVIGATNRPEAIDPALRRPGRFDREIYFPLPSEKDRSAILSLHTRSWPKPLSGTLLSWIANQTVGYAGADLQALCTQAVMNALKRNFALKDLLSSAEKGFVRGGLPSLPSLVVEEKDWLAALALAPPPCSRREAGMAANDVVSSPLPTHLTPCLLQPLSLLLSLLYNDERIWLPPILSKAAKSIKSIIFSALEQRRMPTSSWLSHLHHLIQEKCILKEIEANLYRYGLIGVSSVGSDTIVSDDDSDGQKFDSVLLRCSSANMYKSMKKFSVKSKSLSGFRLLISGCPRSGQRHLASCLLHGFMGHVEIQKVNLATIAQEGHGDMLRGLTQMLSKCMNLGHCIIYMPRIDLWAINENPMEDVESNLAPHVCKSLTASNGTKSVSEIWNSFVEQVDSACTYTSLIIMATCEIQSHDLPMGIKQFFTRDVFCDDSAATEHTIPRFSVHTDGTFNRELIISSSAVKLSTDLAQNFVQLLHQRTHQSSFLDKTNVTYLDAQKQDMANGQSIGLMEETSYTEQIDFSSMASCRNDRNKQSTNSDTSYLINRHEEASIHPSSHQDSFMRVLPGKATMGNLTLAIATFGYQILRYPQFAELCWVTSKLREGPCADVNGPWKSWPFNSCLMSDSNSPAGGNSSIQRENCGLVRGLTAVGLLSYRGVYDSAEEVAIEVRKVLELLVGQIRSKIVTRKDRYQHLRILSQVAYLEDMVNSWAYKFQSLRPIKPTTESKTNHPKENNSNGGKTIGVQSHSPSFLGKRSTEEENLLTENSAKSFIEEPSNQPLLTSDMCMIPETEQLREYVPSASLTSTVHLSPSLAVTMLVGGDVSCGTEGPELSKRIDSLEQLTGLEMTENNPAIDGLNDSANATNSNSKDVHLCCNSLGTVLPSKDAEFVSEKPCRVAEITPRKEGDILAASKISCLYGCCSGCLHALYMLAHDFLSQVWESNGSSTVEDVNNTVSSCSLNLLAAFRKCDMSETRNNSKNMFLALKDCSCHLRNEGKGAADSDSPSGQALKYFYRDGVLASSEPHKDDALHCTYDKLCMCSLIEMIKEITRLI